MPLFGILRYTKWIMNSSVLFSTSLYNCLFKLVLPGHWDGNYIKFKGFRQFNKVLGAITFTYTICHLHLLDYKLKSVKVKRF